MAFYTQFLSWISRKSRSFAFWTAHMAVIALSWLAQLIFPSRLALTRVVLKSPSLSKSVGRTVKIVQLTDFHCDISLPEKISRSTLKKVVEMTNAENPDFIMLTGDYVDREPEAIHHLTPYLRQLRAQHGIFATLGNHDYKGGSAGKQMITKVLRDCGITVLNCDDVRPFPAHPNFEIVGIGDIVSKQDFRPEKAFIYVPLPDMDTDTTRILLSHNPDTAKYFTEWKVDLQLSGHSHGGQICLPFTGTPVLRYFRALHDSLPKAFGFLRRYFPKHVHAMQNWDLVAGLHGIRRSDGGMNWLYVSRGLATHPPCRIYCPMEVNVIELVPLPS